MSASFTISTILLLISLTVATEARAENLLESTLPTNETIVFKSPLEDFESLEGCDVRTQFHRVREGIHHYILSRTQVSCVNSSFDGSWDLLANYGYTGPRDARHDYEIYVHPTLVGSFQLIASFDGPAAASHALNIAAQLSNEYLDYYGRNRWLLYPRFMLLTPLLGRPCYNTAEKIEQQLKALSQQLQQNSSLIR